MRVAVAVYRSRVYCPLLALSGVAQWGPGDHGVRVLQRADPALLHGLHLRLQHRCVGPLLYLHHKTFVTIYSLYNVRLDYILPFPSRAS
jgi:hypothetical protein